jgi:anti-sigma B factor antagonist
MSNAAAVNFLTLDVELKTGKALIHCHGRLVGGTSNVLYARVHELLPVCKRITLDLTDLKFVDSMGLGTLVGLYISAKKVDSCLELINLGKQIRELLGITHLLGVFAGMCEQGITMKF